MIPLFPLSFSFVFFLFGRYEVPCNAVIVQL
jgi:hypothetical protein